MAKTVILAAGKSTRLDGKCKLLIDAAGTPVHAWHSRVWGSEADAVILPEFVDKLSDAGWTGGTYGIDCGGGPARALPAGEIRSIVAEFAESAARVKRCGAQRSRRSKSRG